ncbi:HtaA domain-containing protein [Kitasatospora purpeofusca]|uniref:HtaA domain-containing protein n=1 Tax=Kitasatospora purpeofusca TaxID=67352 RepID=UPI002A5AD0D2|nr:HtaA domain-containing protein [Kitasatospora purpeofusca]MDY0813490.1 HtaA domain-containing protein [Kitasatospora purpeofusca]
MPLPHRLRRTAAALVAALAALLTVVVLPGRAVAAEGGVSGGRLDWGIKQSFLAYVTGPVAKGTWALTGGAATVSGSGFRFHSAAGSYDPASGALTAAFSGGVRFTGHQENGANALDLSIGRLTFRAAAGGAAGLYADVSSKSRETGQVANAGQAKLAELSLAGVDLRGAAGTLTLGNVPATLTEAGAKAFGGFYTAGTALDPVSLSVNLPAAQPTSTPSAPVSPSAATPSASAPAATAPAARTSPATPTGPATPTSPTAPTGPATPTGPAATPQAAPATGFANGALDWGVRRTFRDYVTGSIAQGRWETSGGAADGGAFFRWTPAEGSYDPATGALTAAFTGSVRFTGLKSGDSHGLDLTLANTAVTVADGRGVLRADVSGRTPDGAAQQLTGVELGTFDPAGLTTEGGLLKAVELPLTLTEPGGKAFGGLYPAGTAMDPLSFAVALDPAAALPPLPDLGSAPAVAPAPSATTAPPTPPAAPVAAPVAAAAGDSGGVPTAAVVGGGLLAAASAVTAGLLVLRRRRRATPADAA